MLNCDERAGPALLLALEDLLANLWCARRAGNVGRLAALSYGDARGWARVAHDEALEARSRELLANCPHSSRDDFMFAVDGVIDAAERAHAELARDAALAIH
jgi:hypothetical protein